MGLQLSKNFLACWILKGKIITTDAMGCPEDIAEKIQKQGGDLFAVKGAGQLNKAFEEKFPAEKN